MDEVKTGRISRLYRQSISVLCHSSAPSTSSLFSFLLSLGITSLKVEYLRQVIMFNAEQCCCSPRNFHRLEAFGIRLKQRSPVEIALNLAEFERLNSGLPDGAIRQKSHLARLFFFRRHFLSETIVPRQQSRVGI
jgi:hypothetical protein